MVKCIYCADSKYAIQHRRCSNDKVPGNIKLIRLKTTAKADSPTNFEAEYNRFVEGGLEFVAEVPTPGEAAPKSTLTQILEALKRLEKEK